MTPEGLVLVSFTPAADTVVAGPLEGRTGAYLIVPDAEGRTLETVAEVLRLERNPVQPLAALQLLGETDEWRGLVWEPAAIKEREADEDYDEYEN